MARVVLLGHPHHVTQRGNHRQDVFLCENDFLMYLRLLREHARRFHLKVLSYCLMTNHVHLVVIPEREESLSKGLGRAHNDYARWFHIKHGRTGHLWQNRFFSCPLEQRHLAETLRYVELNSVRAGLAQHAWDWKWSSAAARIAGVDPEGLLQLDTRREDCTGEAWREILKEGWYASALSKRIQEATQTGRPLGGDSFFNLAENQTGRQLRPRKPGPKSKVAGAPMQIDR